MNVHDRVRAFALIVLLAAGCGSEPPRWSAEALSIEEVTGTRIAVSWPAAEGASAYVVHIDGEPAARLGPRARSYAADQLEEASEHTIEVHALDEAGESSSVLRATTTTLDVTAPSFAEDARLEVRIEPPVERGASEGEQRIDAPRDVVLRWPAATDNVAVARYRVLRGEDEVALIDAPETSARLSALALAEAERFEVRPLDAAGNEGARGLIGAQRVERTAAPRDVEQRTARMALELAQAQRQVDSMLLGAFGGPGGGRLEDVLGPTMPSDLLAQAEGVGAARSSEAPREGGGGGLGIWRGGGELGAPMRGRATLGAVERVGGGGTSELARALRLRLRALGRCYERELRTSPELAGRVRARFTIEPNGTVSVAEAVERTPIEALNECALRLVRVRFNPAPEGGPATFEASFHFAPR